MNRIIGILAATTAITFAGTANAQECGDLTIASMNWQSAELAAAVDQFILNNGYGCNAEIIQGDTVPTITSMVEKGAPQIAPEGWIDLVPEVVQAGLAEGKIVGGATILSDGAVQGWWIPKYIADANPDIKSIQDVLKHPELFPAPADKSKGAVFNCPSGWSCQLTTGNAYKAWGADKKGFMLVDTGSAAGLDGSIAKAYERQQGWLGYYWAPTAILGKYDMVKLDAGVPFDKVAFDTCNTKADCDNPTKTDWAKSEVFTVVTDRFKKTAGPANDYLTKRSWSNTTVNQLLSWMSDNQATGEDGARHFLKTQPAVWQAWVSAEVAQKVSQGL